MFVIGNRVTIHEGTIIGDGTTIDDGAILGKIQNQQKQVRCKFQMKFHRLEIGKDVTIGANCVVYRGAIVGSKVHLVADLATVRENVEIGDYVIVGRMLQLKTM